MICRMWRGRVPAPKADEYVRYVERTGVSAHRQTPGNLGSMILTRVMGDVAEIRVVSFWESLDAIRRFAGERPEVAVYFPEDEKYLLELEPEVLHCDVPVARLALPLGDSR